MTLKASEISKILGIDSIDDRPISCLLTDSRDLTYPAETLFFALRTAGNNGHFYIPDLISKGVRHFVVDGDYKAPDMPDCEFWHVENVLNALQNIAVAVRNMYPSLPVIGITGSRGKTIVKELLYKLLSPHYKIARSPRSYNSQIGVPLSIWELTPGDTLAIFESGISQPDEMQRLQRMIRPTIGIFTSLTDEHDAGFESMQQKAEEKATLFEECADIFYPQGEVFIANAISAYSGRKHAVAGGNEEMAIEVATFVANKDVSHNSIAGWADKISPRIDVCETLKNCIVVYDGFTSGLRSLDVAINYARRHTAPGRKMALVLGNADTYDKDALHRLLQAKGISRVIPVASPQEFMSKFSISDFKDEVILISGPAAEGYDDVKTHLEAPRHETVMEIDLGAIASNFNYYRSLLRPGTGLIAMVKAAGYGVGALELSKTLQNQGASYLAVAVIEEGAELRRGGITMPIIVMNPISTNFKALFENKLEPSVFSMRELDLLISNAERLGIEEYPVHIKLDTGMHRLGFMEEELPHLLSKLNSQKRVRVSTIFSHLATADCLDEDEYTMMQLETFERMSTQIMNGLPYKAKRHILNTAGMMRYPQYDYDFARLGIGLYGISPLPEQQTHLKTVAQLFTTIISLKEWPESATIGYGRRGRLEKPSIIATVPIGYADGLDRHLSCGGASFVVNGKECPIIGNICMDLCMIDVTGADAHIGDKAEVFGKQMPLQRLSETLGTIPYEILTSVSPRVKRIYFRY